MGHPLAGWREAHNMIKSIAPDQPQKNLKYVWLDFRLGKTDAQSIAEAIFELLLR
jgi:hypothetical protein